MVNRPIPNGFSPDSSRLASPATLLTITGQTAKMHGRFEIADSLHVECEMGGELVVGGQLVIGERGEVSADVQTVDAIIQGSYAGNLIATGTVEITATGRVTGNIETDSLVISKGGFFNGNVVRTRSHPAPSTVAPTAEDRLTVAL
jgi:cytoskeletal protein CcmA (bactofilin family)